jgi:hypothetical protein
MMTAINTVQVEREGGTRKYSEDIPGKYYGEELQKEALLGRAHILRKMLIKFLI